LKTVTKKLYEAMFLVDSALAASDWDGINTTIKSILERVAAEIVSIRKWDERRLAYAINGKTRGTYILCYFKADGQRIREAEREIQLSEQIMRVLILCAEGREQDIEKDTPATAIEKAREKAAQQTVKEPKAEPESNEETTEEAQAKPATAGQAEPEQKTDAEAVEKAEAKPTTTEQTEQETKEETEAPVDKEQS